MRNAKNLKQNTMININFKCDKYVFDQIKRYKWI